MINRSYLFIPLLKMFYVDIKEHDIDTRTVKLKTVYNFK